MQGFRKLDPWDTVASDKTYLVGQKEISTHGRLHKTHSRLDKLTADWTNCPADGTNCHENIAQSLSLSILVGNVSNIADGCTVLRQLSFFFLNKSQLKSQIVPFTVFCGILNKFLTYTLSRTIAGWKHSGFKLFFLPSGALVGC